MQNKEGENTKGTRGGLRKREKIRKRTETTRQQKEEEEREEARIEINKLKRMMEDKKRRERKNNLVIKGSKGKGKKKPDRECTEIFRERIRGERGSERDADRRRRRKRGCNNTDG